MISCIFERENGTRFTERQQNVYSTATAAKHLEFRHQLDPLIVGHIT